MNNNKLIQSTLLCFIILISLVPHQTESIGHLESTNEAVVEPSIVLEYEHSNGNIYQVDSILEQTYLNNLDVTSTAMDTDGNLYVSGTIGDSGTYVNFEPLGVFNPTYNISGRSYSAKVSFVAKLTTQGDWAWVNIAEPLGYTTTGCHSSSDVNESSSLSTSLAEHNGYVYMTGFLRGCIDFGGGHLVSGTSSTEQVGFIYSMKSVSGDTRWVKPFLNTNGNKAGSIIPNNIITTTIGSDTKIFLSGSIVDAVISTPNGNYSSGNDGDAFVMRISDSTTNIEIFRDTCNLNDPQVNSDCGNGINEKIASMVLIGDDLYLGVNVFFPTSGTTSFVFGNTDSVAATSGASYAYGTALELDTLADSFGTLFDLNGGKAGWGVREGLQYQGEPLFITGYLNQAFPMVLQSLDGTEITNLSKSSGTGAWPKDLFIHYDDNTGWNGIYLIVSRAESGFSPVLSDGSSSYNLSHDGTYLVNLLNLQDSIEWNSNFVPGRFSHVHAVNDGGLTRVGLVGEGANDVIEARTVSFSSDSDGDGIPDLFDAHIFVPAGSDPDNDGIPSSLDNCPSHWNVNQENNDGDFYGDACDTDIDGDSILNSIPVNLTSPDNDDECPYVYANASRDTDNDGCVDDTDGDGVVDAEDICPNYADGDDADGDGIPDGCDTYPDDFDNDNVPDTSDNCQFTLNQEQGDLDSDGIGDACDTDIDGDQILNSLPLDPTNATDDECPFVDASGQDENQDGCIDIASPDNDTDGDGVLNHLDRCPGFNDSIDDDADGIIDGCDEHPNDSDNDGIINPEDNCIYVSNFNQANMNGGLQGDACDSDIDGDGITNIAPLHLSVGESDDKCPYVNASGQDLDGDGCIDSIEPVECEVCQENNTGEAKPEGNTSSPLLDPDDVGTVVVVGGTGAAVGGSTALGLLALRKLRDGGRYLGVEDGIVIVKHLPRVKKKDDDSDHYFQRGLIRQQEMTKSADPRSDDYVEFEEEPGASAEEILSANEEEASQ